MPVTQSHLALIQASPFHVERHEKDQWLELFAAESTIEDPVGAGIHTKANGDAAAFYDTFIRPNDIAFRVKHDFVCGDQIARDVCIDTHSPGGLSISVPAHLLYTLTTVDGQSRFTSLQAHWELREMSKLVLKQGWPGLKTLASTSVRMIHNQGFKGTAHYLRGMLSGIFKRGHQTAFQLRDALAAKDLQQVSKLFVDPAQGKALCDRLGRIDNFQIGTPISSGWTTSFSYQMQNEKGSYQGLAFLAFDKRSKKIRSFNLLEENTTFNS